MDEAYGILINEDVRDEWHTGECGWQHDRFFSSRDDPPLLRYYILADNNAVAR